MSNRQWFRTAVTQQARRVPLLLGPLLLLSACGDLTQPPTRAVLVYVSAEAIISCPHPVFINHGPDPVRSGFEEVPVGATSGLLVLPRPNTPSITVDSAVFRSDAPYSFDLGFRCSDDAPELRQPYPVYSQLTLKLDAAAPSGLGVDVQRLVRPD